MSKRLYRQFTEGEMSVIKESSGKYTRAQLAEALHIDYANCTGMLRANRAQLVQNDSEYVPFVPPTRFPQFGVSRAMREHVLKDRQGNIQYDEDPIFGKVPIYLVTDEWIRHYTMAIYNY